VLQSRWKNRQGMLFATASLPIQAGTMPRTRLQAGRRRLRVCMYAAAGVFLLPQKRADKANSSTPRWILPYLIRSANCSGAVLAWRSLHALKCLSSATARLSSTAMPPDQLLLVQPAIVSSPIQYLVQLNVNDFNVGQHQAQMRQLISGDLVTRSFVPS
jgi:hypothetical protein